MEKIQQALIQLLLSAFASWQPLRIAWENKAFTAPKGEPWMAVHFMPADERIKTLGEDGFDEANGLFQVTLNYPLGVGEGSARATIEMLRSCFKPQVVIFEEQGVSILSRSRSNGREVDGFYAIPFTVRWRSQLTR